MISINKFWASINEGSYKPCYWARALDQFFSYLGRWYPLDVAPVRGLSGGMCTRSQTRADQNSSTSSCHWLASTPNYIFWLRFWQIDVARLWNLVCLSPSWQYFQVYNLPALESNDGFTNAQCTLSLVFVTCCKPNHSALMIIVETILNIIYVCLHNSLMLHSSGSALPSWHFPNTPVMAQSRLWWMLSNWAQWHLNHWILPKVCFCYWALEYRYIIIDILFLDYGALKEMNINDARNSVHYVYFPLIYVWTGNIYLLGYTTVTNFIWSYLHQFFNDSHGLKASLKPLRRPFNWYQSHLEAINIGRDIRQINR